MALNVIDYLKLDTHSLSILAYVDMYIEHTRGPVCTKHTHISEYTGLHAYIHTFV